MPQPTSCEQQPASYYHWLGRDAVGLYWIEESDGQDMVPVAILPRHNFNRIEVTTVSDTERQFIHAFPTA